MTREALDLKISGVVQGVGFRPFVYREAKKREITGWVLNDVEGVKVHAEGETLPLDRFVLALSEEEPAAAQVREIEIKEVPVEGFDTFEIRFSDAAEQDETTLVSPDLATCDACVEELFDPENRRYHYPFINCTNCGPRFTIMRKLPYDRPETSMVQFEMCPACQAEYDNPADRRFHAQPDACFECGPEIGWIEADAQKGLSPEGISWAKNVDESDAIFQRAAQLIKKGGIVAVKGLGGYHLVCDAANETALAALRARKHRPGKAFAVMLSSVEEARTVCQVNDAEAAQLRSPARPIVLLRKRSDASLAKGLADELPELGVMLPTTPVQHLLLHECGGMLVMTSGNIHDEPIVIDEETAFSQLAGVADAFLVNNREIVGRYDDSVVRIIDGGAAGDIVQFIRRARGYAPLPVAAPCPENSKAELLAVGPEQKSTLTYARSGKAFVSQHVGDLESAAVFDAWNETRARYADLLHFDPKHLVCDYHPEYLSTKWALSRGMPVTRVQHHHAHILSVMGENNLEGPVCGFAFDGTGYGLDGAIWGGEVLLSNLQAYERFVNFAYIPLPGGAAAIKDPARIAYGALWSFDLLEHEQAQRFVSEHVPHAEVFQQMIEKGLNTPETSSVGRIFDAASALLGICLQPRYEGEAAILLEAAAHRAKDEADGAALEDDRYRVEFIKNTATENSTAADTSVLLMDVAPVFAAMLDDMQEEVPASVIAARFHGAFVRAIVDVAELVRATYGIEVMALAGGVFMNRYLLERVLARLQERGFTVALNKELPPNDASISYGQAVLGLQAQHEE